MKIKETAERQAMKPSVDRLPPHSEEAERGALGCVMLDPSACMERMVEWSSGDERVFYLVTHQDIFRAMLAMWKEQTPIDIITLAQRLKDTQRLETAGGSAYLSALGDGVPGATNLEHYLGIVWEKYLARQQVASSTEIVSSIYEWQGMPEGLWAKIHRLHEDWQAMAQRNTGATPRELVRPSALEADYIAQWRRTSKAHKGWDLPFALADFAIRPYEFTILGGDSETGKSTWLKELLVCLIRQDVTCLLCTLEEPGGKALFVLSRQVLGRHQKPCDDKEEQEVWEALAYLEKKLWIYNFLGIGQWRSILDSFVYAADKLGVQFFVLDGIGLIGIGDEDLEAQGLAAAQFAAFCHTRPVHLVGVQHTVKDSEGGFKKRLRGNKRWTDFTDNLIEWERNEKKREGVTKILADQEANDAKLKVKGMDLKEHGEKRKELQTALDNWDMAWDASCTLRKQKWGEGERRNARKYLWYHWSSRQFHTSPKQGPINYLLK